MFLIDGAANQKHVTGDDVESDDCNQGGLMAEVSKWGGFFVQEGSSLLSEVNDAILNGSVADVLAPENSWLDSHTFRSGADTSTCTIAIVGPTTDEHERLSEFVAAWVARRGHHLMVAGLDGVARRAAKGFAKSLSREGRCVGVLPESFRRRFRSKREDIYVDVPVFVADSGVMSTLAASADVLVVLCPDQKLLRELRQSRDKNIPCVVFTPAGNDDCGDFKSIQFTKSADDLLHFIDAACVAASCDTDLSCADDRESNTHGRALSPSDDSGDELSTYEVIDMPKRR